MAKREFLQQAHKFNPDKHAVYGYYMSEKLDGVRMFWDGGVSRGVPATDVPWANTTKHGRYLTPLVATGLWTRYGQPIQAPDYWLDTLPKVPLDGEAYRGRGQFQSTLSVVRSLTGREGDWRETSFQVFESPSLRAVLADGRINNPNFKKLLCGCVEWAEARLKFVPPQKPFYYMLNQLAGTDLGPYVRLHEQVKLPSSRQACLNLIQETAAEVTDKGGEGLILRSPISFWRPERTYDLLKVKPYDDTEGTVIGYRWGDKTDISRSVDGTATNKLLGLMGSLRLKLDSGVEFDLSGFTNAERQMTMLDGRESDAAKGHGLTHPGEVVPDWIHNPLFPRGARVTFRFRELTEDGVPKEARFLRSREEV